VPPHLHVALLTAAAAGFIVRTMWQMIAEFSIRRGKDGLDIRLRIRPPYRW
jgi:hypothetical protein